MKIFVAAPPANANANPSDLVLHVISAIEHAGLRWRALRSIDDGADLAGRAAALMLQARRDVLSCDAMLVIAAPGGTDMYTLVEFARVACVPIFWCGPPTLSAFDPVVRIRVGLNYSDIDQAVRAIAALKDA